MSNCFEWKSSEANVFQLLFTNTYITVPVLFFIGIIHFLDTFMLFVFFYFKLYLLETSNI